MKWVLIFGLLISLALAIFVSPFASQSPDGLEKVAEDKGFISKSEGKEIIHSLFPDYTIPGIKQEKLSTSFAGAIGVIITFSIALIIGYIFKK
jgi:cobalt/nickel transport protein